MLAAAILLIAISGLLAAFISCILLNEANSELITAAHDAEYVLEQTKAMAYVAIANSSYTDWGVLRNEQRQIDVVSGAGDYIKTITVTIRWNGRNGRQREFQLVTQIARTG